MAEKIARPVLLAAVLGSGLALGSAGLAFASAAPIEQVRVARDPITPTPTITTITPRPTVTTTIYPPTPTVSEQEVEFDDRKFEDEDDFDRDTDTSFQRNQSFVNVEVDDRVPEDFEHHYRSPAARELPFTGAPVSTLAAAGAGLLIIGAAGTIIAVRRRRTASAK
ncbi:hypothetical protein [Nonomuraea sp. NPDC049400]|uniref:hypothetical protein n=1 Tax=Nonomuraea sp. NPDC049400 TaxID=3364352 RepID=UPI0037AA933D